MTRWAPQRRPSARKVTGTTTGATLTDSGYATAAEDEPDPSDNPATTSELVQAATVERPGHRVSFHLGTGLGWLTWAGGGTVLLGLLLLVLAGRRMVVTKSGR